MAPGNSRWYLLHDGKQEGPVTWGELAARAQSGRLRPKDRVLREGSRVWQPAHTARDVTDESTDQTVTGPHGRPSVAAIIDDDAADDVGNIEGLNVGRMLFGILLCGGGIVGTIAGYNAAVARGGGKYLIFTGPIVYGLTLIFRSFRGPRNSKVA